MKKILKIFSITAILAIALCLAIGFSVSADEGAPTIISKNIAYGESVYLYVAVDNSGFENADIEVLFYTEDPSANTSATAYKATKSQIEYTPNPAFPTYRSFGIPAKAIGDTIYARTHVLDTDVYGDVIEYSVVEYLLDMRYTASATQKQIDTYDALLNYGAKADRKSVV